MVRVFKILFHPLTRPVGLVRFFLLSIAGQVQDLQRGLFGGEMASPHRCFAEPGVQRLDGVCIGYETPDAPGLVF